jgi:hypothetical protein
MKKLEVVTVATETPRGMHSHALGAHAPEDRGSWGLHWLPAGENGSERRLDNGPKKSKDLRSKPPIVRAADR